MAENKITKSDIVDKVRLATHVDRKIVQDIFDNVLEELKNSLKNGATIELRGFGTLEPRLRKGRSQARNPRTGEIVSVEPHYVAAFRAGQEIRKALLERPVEK